MRKIIIDTDIGDDIDDAFALLMAIARPEDEILGVIHLIRDLMNLFDFQFKVAISTRPEDSSGTD